MKDNPEAQAKLERVSAQLTDTLERLTRTAADLANLKQKAKPHSTAKQKWKIRTRRDV